MALRNDAPMFEGDTGNVKPESHLPTWKAVLRKYSIWDELTPVAGPSPSGRMIAA